MLEVLGRVLKALKSLQPKFKNTGAGAVQIGKAGGSVHIGNTTRHEVTHVHLTQHIVYGPPAASPVRRSASVLDICGAHPNGQSASPQPSKLGRYANEAQREVLRMLVSIGTKETAVLDFMEREFGTRKVIDLQDAQLHRTRRYVETIQRRALEPAKAGVQSHVNHEFL